MTIWETIRRDRRVALGLLALALLLTGVALAGPRVARQVALRDLLLTVDITRSMNARDMDGQSRLDAVKRILPEVLARLPCGSRAGLAVFTERRTLTFMEPVEICANYAALTGSIHALDWRMAWEGDSMIARGLIHARDRAEALGADLVFVTDGQEAPPLPYAGPPPFRAEPGRVGGVIVGAGRTTPVPIPRFDRDGREIGFYRPEDVQQAPARIGEPPPDAAERPGYHPRNNPYGEADLTGEEHLSGLRADYLRERAKIMGLGYAALTDGPQRLTEKILASTHARQEVRPVSVAVVPAALAVVCLIASYLTGLVGRR